MSKCDPHASGTDGPLLVFHGDVSSLWQFPPIFRPSQPYPVQPYTFPSSYSNLSEFRAGNATTVIMQCIVEKIFFVENVQMSTGQWDS